jgi:hypothetical protein
MSVIRTALVPIRRLPRLPRLLMRPLVLGLLWGRRHTVMLWVRSVRDELRRGGGLQPRRLRTLLSALVRVTTDGRLTNAAELRRLHLQGDVLHADVDEHWARRGVLRATLGAVEGVNVVRLTGAEDAVTNEPMVAGVGS